MDTRTELIEALNRSYKKMGQACEMVDQEREIYPGWTKKELLVHLIAWDMAAADSLRAFIQGDPAVIVSNGSEEDMDQYNASFVEERKDVNYYAVYRERQYAREQLLEAVKKLPREALAETMTYPWSKNGTPAELIKGIASHEEYHAKFIFEMIVGEMH